MCWFLRVYWTVLHNLFIRCVTNVGAVFYNNGICCCCCKRQEPERKASVECGSAPEAVAETSLQHDYVIVDEIDAGYLQIEPRKIETEPYYLTVDRASAEDILTGRANGSCLVRPYREADICIKYIVSVYSQGQFFHLFIRRIRNPERYGIGQKKPHEKYFNTPSDIIDFYSCNALQCTNKNCCQRLTLKPIIA